MDGRDRLSWFVVLPGTGGGDIAFVIVGNGDRKGCGAEHSATGRQPIDRPPCREDEQTDDEQATIGDGGVQGQRYRRRIAPQRAFHERPASHAFGRTGRT